MNGVSFVVPVHNGGRWIRHVLTAIAGQADGRPMEILVVDDASRDDSVEQIRALPSAWPIRLIPGCGRGAAAAINAGVRAARHAIICQVDQDVVIGDGWMQRLAACLDEPGVGAAQGYYAYDASASLCARVMNRDLEWRYAAIAGEATSHICTGNAVYRAEALRAVGLFDERLGYGYDNDMSYRLAAAGYRLRICRQAVSVHRWREGLFDYCSQQYGFGYGRLDLVWKHRRRVAGDSVSPAAMMAHGPLMALTLAGFACAGLAWALGRSPRPFVLGSGLVLAALAVERMAAGIVAAGRFRDLTPLAFPALHLVRDLAWVVAMIRWTVHRLAGLPSAPSHSMVGRPVVIARSPGPVVSSAPLRLLCVIPAYNEAPNLTAVVEEIRGSRPGMDILVADDGSDDGTEALLPQLGIKWLRFPQRLGVGSAVRAALRYADRAGYDAAVRMDGDGQHTCDDANRLLEPILAGSADVVLGSRYVGTGRNRGATALVQRLLAVCLSSLTHSRITDPTSGFYALGPRAMRLLAEHHPSGYAEAELRLFLSRNLLDVVEMPVRERSRLSGRTSLTPWRLVGAAARVILAMAIVPLRRMVGERGD